jgi:hypothetical protein
VNQQTSLVGRTRTLSMGATGNLVFDLTRTKNFGLIVSWTAAAAPNGTFTFLVSSDGVNFIAYTGIAVPSSPAGAAGSWFVEKADFCFNYFQVVYTRASGGAGDVITARESAKG